MILFSITPVNTFRRFALLILAALVLFKCDFFDITPPDIKFISPSTDTEYFGTIPVELKATDNRGVDRVELFLDGESIYEFSKGPYKTDIDLSQINASTVTLKAIAYDKADNHADASRDVTLTIGLRLTSPNGGETWPEHSTQLVTWESSGNVGSSVSLHYSIDGGNNWDGIIASTPNSGSYSWTIPNFIETEPACKIKVSTSGHNDVSDSTFTINAEPNSLVLTSPNGGEVWAEQSTHNITWSSSGDVGENVSLHYSLDGGTTWTQIASATPNDDSYPWSLPNLLESATNCQLKIASTTTAYGDASDTDFTISAEANFIALTSPNGGEVWAEQSTQTITWNSSGDVGGNVSLHFSLNGGGTWTQIIASTSNDGSHPWTLPNLFETAANCRVIVSSTSTSFADKSAAAFTITAGPNFITLTSPNGGEIWDEQSTHEITWTSSGDVGDNVSLNYSLDGGSTWNEIVASTPSDGTQNWVLPDLFLTSNSCLLKVNSAVGIGDISDDLFTIDAEELVLVSPNGGENWLEWSAQTITWASTSKVGSQVSLQYSFDGGTTWMDLFVSTPNDGSQTWNIPTVATTQNNSRIRINSTTVDESDISDTNFTIENWTPTLMGAYDTPGYASEVFVVGNMAFVPDGNFGLSIIDVTDPHSPILAGVYNASGNAIDVHVSENTVYTIFAQSGADPDTLHLVDVSNPSTLISMGKYSGRLIVASDIYVSANLAYLTDRGYGLVIIDISDPQSPSLVGFYDAGLSNTDGVFVSDTIAYIADARGGLKIIDITIPSAPSLAGTYGTPDWAANVYVLGSIAYITVNRIGLKIVDISNPTNPTLLGSYESSASFTGVHVSGGTAFLTNGYSGLKIIDVSNPQAPTLIESYNIPGYATGVYVLGNTVYVTDADNGLLIIDVDGLP